MKDMVEIEVVLDERYTDPLVTIKTRSNTQQVENIIRAIEDASHSNFPQIAAVKDDAVVFVSQRDIVRVHTEGRKIMIQTENEAYTVIAPHGISPCIPDMMICRAKLLSSRSLGEFNIHITIPTVIPAMIPISEFTKNLLFNSIF